MVSVVIADDEDLIRGGLHVMLAARGVTVLGEAGNGRDAIGAVREHRPDVVLMDLRMPVLGGIEATREICRLGLPARVLVLTTFDLDELVHEALRAGAAGFLLKTATPDRVAEAVRAVAGGERSLAPELTERLITRYVHAPAPVDRPAALDSLTDRELEVFRLIAYGRSNDEIGAGLLISDATVKTHLNRLFRKLGLASRVQAAILAYECDLIRPGDGGPDLQAGRQGPFRIRGHRPGS